jgi:hypothetical protein
MNSIRINCVLILASLLLGVGCIPDSLDPKQREQKQSSASIHGGLVFDKSELQLGESCTVTISFTSVIKDNLRIIDYRVRQLSRYDKSEKQFVNQIDAIDEVQATNICDLDSISYFRDGTFNFRTPHKAGYMFDCKFRKIGVFLFFVNVVDANGQHFETSPAIIRVFPPKDKKGIWQVTDEMLP